MKRSALYAMVWAKPMTQLAAELGISDVGLAKACRRHAVPAPPRGYWAKLKAGQKPPQTPLPTPELDVVVQFAQSDPAERERQRIMERKRTEVLNAVATPTVTRVVAQFSVQLDDAHPLVKASQRYCERIPRLIEQYKRRGVHAWSLTKQEDRPPSDSYGRYSLLHHGLLDITASLDLMPWVLQFHASIFRGLVAGGMAIARREAPTGRPISRSEGPAIEARFKGEIFTIQFSQGYRRAYLDADELAKKRKESSWAREYETQPSEKLTFTISGSEYRAKKTWQGTQEKLQDQVEDIVRTAFQLVPLQMEMREEREAAAAIAKREEEARALVRRQNEAKAEQLKQAFLMVDADERTRRLKDFLLRLEELADELQPPYDERAKVWVKVVRKELDARNPMEEILQRCLSVPSWSKWPPDWWPAESGGQTME
ncbi:hypothetical protein [Variovorax sp. dw_954]|uniref:hypothetical protein n=1 Tax=Variovorax sp. dw_954 TaxID=2720078 RepID=UPI001BD3707C|nr:hypothetical protein [Variovorax sp. dw_954]